MAHETRYVVLLKPREDEVRERERQRLFHPDGQACYLLPEALVGDYATHGLFEAAMIDWCQQFCRGVVLDIGAHTGTYAVSLSRHASHVHAFEPQRRTFYALCGSVALSDARNVECHNVALGSVEQVGQRTLCVVSPDGGGSTLHPGSQAVLSQETVDVRTLDSYQLSGVSFIKLDVEDNELHVLRGATETLRRCGFPPVLFECNADNPPLFEFVSSLGYRLTRVAWNMFFASTD